MRTPCLPRLATRLLAGGITAALAYGVPASAEAKTWSVPSSVSDHGAEAAGDDDLEDALMVHVNDARVAAGLRKIWNFDVCTDELSEQWGSRIARTGTLEHRDQFEVIRGCRYSWAGETLVRGVGLGPADMVALWLDSPGHRAILLSPRARRAGVAITQDPQGRVIGVLNLVRRR